MGPPENRENPPLHPKFLSKKALTIGLLIFFLLGTTKEVVALLHGGMVHEFFLPTRIRKLISDFLPTKETSLQLLQIIIILRLNWYVFHWFSSRLLVEPPINMLPTALIASTMKISKEGFASSLISLVSTWALTKGAAALQVLDHF